MPTKPWLVRSAPSAPGTDGSTLFGTAESISAAAQGSFVENHPSFQNTIPGLPRTALPKPWLVMSADQQSTAAARESMSDPATGMDRRMFLRLTGLAGFGAVLGAIDIGAAVQGVEAQDKGVRFAAQYLEEVLSGALPIHVSNVKENWENLFGVKAEDTQAVKDIKAKYQELLKDDGLLLAFVKALFKSFAAARQKSGKPYVNAAVNIELALQELLPGQKGRIRAFLKHSLARFTHNFSIVRSNGKDAGENKEIRDEVLLVAGRADAELASKLKALLESADSGFELNRQNADQEKVLKISERYLAAEKDLNVYLTGHGFYVFVSMNMRTGKTRQLYMKSYEIQEERQVITDGKPVRVLIVKGIDAIVGSNILGNHQQQHDFAVVFIDNIENALDMFEKWLAAGTSDVYADREKFMTAGQKEALEKFRKLLVELLKKDFEGLTREQRLAKLIDQTAAHEARHGADKGLVDKDDHITLEERAFAAELASGILPNASLVQWVQHVFGGDVYDVASERVFLAREKLELSKELAKQDDLRIRLYDFERLGEILKALADLPRERLMKFGGMILARPVRKAPAGKAGARLQPAAADQSFFAAVAAAEAHSETAALFRRSRAAVSITQAQQWLERLSHRSPGSKISLDATQSFAKHDKEVREQQLSKQTDFESKLSEFHEALLLDIQENRLRLIGALPPAVVRQLEDKVRGWTQGNIRHIVLVGEELDSSAQAFLEGLTTRSHWGRQMQEQGRPQGHLLDSHDQGALNRLLKKIPAADRRQVKVVRIGPVTNDTERFLLELRKADRIPEANVEEANSALFNARTVGLLAAGLLDVNFMARIYEAARRSYKEWLKLRKSDEIKKYIAYQFAAQLIRMADTGINFIVLLMFSTVLRLFSPWFSHLLNKHVGASGLNVFFTGEWATSAYHSIQQGWRQSRGLVHLLERWGFIGIVSLIPNIAGSAVVSGHVNPIYRGFGFDFFLRIFRRALRIPMSQADRPMLDLIFDAKTPEDLGRFLHFAQVSAAMAGKIAEYAVGKEQDKVVEMDRAAAKRRDDARVVPMEDGQQERDQNVLAVEENDGNLRFTGIVGEAIEEGRASTLEGVLKILNLKKRLKSKVLEARRGGLALDHLNVGRIRESARDSEKAAQLFKGKTRVYAISIGGSTTGPILNSALAQADGPEIVEIQSLDVQQMDRILKEIEDHPSPDEIGVIIISKSGTTMETDANGWTVVGGLEKRLGSERVKKNVIFITDPQVGTLVAKVKKEGWRFINHPVLIGGRWSMFSSVGLIFYFLKGGHRADLEKAVNQIDWEKKYEAALKTIDKEFKAIADQYNATREKKGQIKPDDLLDPKADLPLSMRRQALGVLYSALWPVPGAWEGVVKNILNVVWRRDTEVAVSLTSGFEQLVSHKNPFYSQLTVESLGKPGVRRQTVSLNGWGALRNNWNQIVNDERGFVSLFGESVAIQEHRDDEGRIDSELANNDEAEWKAVKEELRKEKVPFISYRTGGPMSPANLLNFMIAQYVSLAVSAALYGPMDVDSEGQMGVEQTKLVVLALTERVNQEINRRLEEYRQEQNVRWRRFWNWLMRNDVEDLLRREEERIRREGVPIPDIPSDRIEQVNEVEMNLARSMSFDENVRTLLENVLIGDENRAGLITEEFAHIVEDTPAHEIQKGLHDLMLSRFSNSAAVSRVIIDGEDVASHREGLVVRITSLESLGNVDSGTANGTSFGIYKKTENGGLELKAGVQILWGSDVRVVVSDGMRTQDYKLKGDGRRIEMFRPGDNNVVLAQKGSFLAPAGFSKKRPQGYQQFEKRIQRFMNTSIRFSDAPSADNYLMMNKQGLYSGWVSWGQAIELARIFEAASGFAVVMTEEGMRPVSDIPVSATLLLSDKEVYVYAGNPDTVKQVQVFMDYLGIEGTRGRPVVLDIIDAFRAIPSQAPLKLRAQALAWALRLKDSLDTLPEVMDEATAETVKKIREALNGSFDGNRKGLFDQLGQVEVTAALTAEYLSLSLPERKERSNEFILLGNLDAGLRFHPGIEEGEPVRMVYALERRFNHAAGWGFLKRATTSAFDGGYPALEVELDKARDILQESYHRDAERRTKPEAEPIPPVEFDEELNEYMDQSAGVPDEVRQFLGLADNHLPENARALYKKLLSVYLNDQEVDLSTDDELRKLADKEASIFYKKDGRSFVRSLHYIRRNLEENKFDPSVNLSGDVSSRLDHIFNTVLIYFGRPMVHLIISEENEEVIQGGLPAGQAGQNTLDGKSPLVLRLLKLLDPIDGSSQIKEGGTFGMIAGIAVIKPGQKISEFDAEKQFLASLEMQYGWPRAMISFVNRRNVNPADGERFGKAEVMQFELTGKKLTGKKVGAQAREMTLKRTTAYESIRRFEKGLEWQGALPVIDSKRGIGFAMGGSFSDSLTDDGHREIVSWLIDTYGYNLGYTGALVNDIRKLLHLSPKQYMGILHTYAATSKHKHGRFRLAFELYHYALMFKVLGGEVIDGHKPMLGNRLPDEEPSGVEKEFYGGSPWITKLIMAWRDYAAAHLKGTNPTAKRMRDELEQFIKQYIWQSTALFETVVRYSQEPGNQVASKTVDQVREAVFEQDGDIMPIFGMSAPEAYKKLFGQEIAEAMENNGASQPDRTGEQDHTRSKSGKELTEAEVWAEVETKGSRKLTDGEVAALAGVKPTVAAFLAQSGRESWMSELSEFLADTGHLRAGPYDLFFAGKAGDITYFDEKVLGNPLELALTILHELGARRGQPHIENLKLEGEFLTGIRQISPFVYSAPLVFYDWGSVILAALGLTALAVASPAAFGVLAAGAAILYGTIFFIIRLSKVLQKVHNQVKSSGPPPLNESSREVPGTTKVFDQDLRASLTKASRTRPDLSGFELQGIGPSRTTSAKPWLVPSSLETKSRKTGSRQSLFERTVGMMSVVKQHLAAARRFFSPAQSQNPVREQETEGAVLSRRAFLKAVGAGAAAAVLAATPLAAQAVDRLALGDASNYDPQYKVRWIDLLPSRDISAYDVLVFRARGKGNLLVRLLNENIPYDQQGALLTERFALTDTEREIRIDLSRFATLGANLAAIKQISFHFGAIVWRENTGNGTDSNAIITRVALEKGPIVQPEKPRYDGRDTIYVDVTGAGRHYFNVLTTQTPREESGNLVDDATGLVTTGRYAFHIFSQSHILGDAVLRIDLTATGKTYLYMVDPTRTRFTYFTAVNSPHPALTQIDTTDINWQAIGEFFHFPKPVVSAEGRTVLSGFIRDLTGTTSSSGFIYRSTILAQRKVNEFKQGALSASPAFNTLIALTMSGPGRRDVEVIHANEAPLTLKPITIRGRDIYRGDEIYLMHGATLSAGHPGQAREQVQFTLAYIGGEAAVELMVSAGINTVRTYYPPEQDLMDAFARHGIMVIAGFTNLDDRWGVPANQKYDIQSGRYLDWIRQFANHPALLAIELGNEYNYLFRLNPQWISDGQGNGAPAWYRQVRHASAAIRELAEYQANPLPISAAQWPEKFGEETVNGVDEVVTLVEEGVLDMVGFNVFRHTTLENADEGHLAAEFARKTQNNPVPMYLSEWGVDWTVDPQEQAASAEFLWNRHVAPAMREGLMSGGTFMTWQNEAWKLSTSEAQANLGMVIVNVVQDVISFVQKPVFAVFQYLWKLTPLIIVGIGLRG
ncbi:MAG: twin-arginine translocation signal domain-containing protein, partial [Candidatus Omnitrophota bacterium]|nr:twin-arginine translocation signal domain-containing protein [Candidatus Omnitrophota bacterium]